MEVRLEDQASLCGEAAETYGGQTRGYDEAGMEQQGHTEARIEDQARPCDGTWGTKTRLEDQASGYAGAAGTF